MSQDKPDFSGLTPAEAAAAAVEAARQAVERRDSRQAAELAAAISATLERLAGSIDDSAAAELETLAYRLGTAGETAVTIVDPWEDVARLLDSASAAGGSEPDATDPAGEAALIERVRRVVEERDTAGARALIPDVQQAATAAQINGDEDGAAAMQALARQLSATADNDTTLIDPWEAALSGLEIAERSSAGAAAPTESPAGEPEGGYRFRAIREPQPPAAETDIGLFDELRTALTERDTSAATALTGRVREACERATADGRSAAADALGQLRTLLDAVADASATLTDPWPDAGVALERAAATVAAISRDVDAAIQPEDASNEPQQVDSTTEEPADPAEEASAADPVEAQADEEPPAVRWRAVEPEAAADSSADAADAATDVEPAFADEPAEDSAPIPETAERATVDADSSDVEAIAEVNDAESAMETEAEPSDEIEAAGEAEPSDDVDDVAALERELEIGADPAVADEPESDAPANEAESEPEDVEPEAAEGEAVAIDEAPLPEADESADGSATPTDDDVAPETMMDSEPDESADMSPAEPDAEAAEDEPVVETPDDTAEASLEINAGDVADALPEPEPETAFDSTPSDDEAVADGSGDEASAEAQAPAPLDPAQPLDPTGGAMPDPNTPLDPTGGAMPDPNTPLDPTGGGGPMELTPEMMAAMMAEEQSSDWGSRPLDLPTEKAELLQFMVGDLREQAEQIEPVLNELTDPMSRDEAAGQLHKIAEEMAATSGFFDFSSLKRLVALLSLVGERGADLVDENADELLIRVRGVVSLIDQLATGLEVGMELTWPLDLLEERVELLLNGGRLHAELRNWHRGDVERLLELDGVQEGVETPPRPATSAAEPGAASPEPAPAAATHAPTPDAQKHAEPDMPVLRVPKPHIDLMQDRVRRLVLTKNRLLGLARDIRQPGDQQERYEELSARTEELSRLVGELQTSVMQTRLMTVEKMFERYQRTIRDVARLNDKEIELKLEGEHTEIDKFLLEELSDPITQLLRAMAAKGIETPAERSAAGKSEQGEMSLSASTQGSQIVFRLTDDGRGIDVEAARERLVRSGITAAETAARLGDGDVLQLLVDPRLDETELAPIGDTLRKLGAGVSVETRPGAGTRLELIVPLTSAVIAAMMVEIGGESYAIPLSGIVEIVRPTRDAVKGINGRPVLRIREQVIPIVDMRCQLAGRNGWSADGFAVVVDAGGRSAALVVDAILGQQEIVIEPLDEECGHGGPFSGATIREDGGVSLIVDVARAMRLAERAGALAEVDDGNGAAEAAEIEECPAGNTDSGEPAADEQAA